MSATSSLDGMWLGRRHMLRRIGVGGMGDVYLAEEPYLNRQVAIKVIRGEAIPGQSVADVDDAQRRFAQEARAVAALDHPNILPLYDYGEQDGLHYLVMPYAPDGSLADLLTRDPQRRFTPPLAPAVASQIISQTAAALQYAHDRGIVHRDVKPHNLLVRLSAPASTPLASAPAPTPNVHILLADFGVARFMEELASQTGATGTPLYSPPEQFAGRPVYASDQYALACVAYLLLTGQPVFRGSIVELYHQHLSVAPTPPSHLNRALSPAVDAALLRALAKQPQDRFPRVEQFAQALTTATQGAVSQSPMPTPAHSAFDAAQTTPARTSTPPTAGQPASATPTSTPIAPETPADRSTGLFAHTPRPLADERQPSLTEIDPNRALSEPYTVPDTAHGSAAAAGYGAPPSGGRPVAPVDVAAARPAVAKPKAGRRRPAQRALLLTLAVAVVLAALAGVGVATHGFAALRGLGAAGAKSTVVATATATTNPTPTATAAPAFYTPSGFTRVFSITFTLAFPSQWMSTSLVEATGPGPEQGSVELSQPHQDTNVPSAAAMESTELGAKGDVEYLFQQLRDNTFPLGQETSLTIAGVTWLERGQTYSAPYPSSPAITEVYDVCIHNGVGYVIHFMSLAAEYGSDYANYDHPILLSFAFINQPASERMTPGR